MRHTVHIEVKKLESGKKALKMDVFRGRNKVFSQSHLHDMESMLVSLDKFLSKSRMEGKLALQFRVIGSGIKDSLLFREVEMVSQALAFLDNNSG